MNNKTEPVVDISSRESLIEWLVWNDRNGCYRDDECIAELGRPLTTEELTEAYKEMGQDA